MLIRILAAFLNTLIPGTGPVLLGHWRVGLIIQVLLIFSVLLLFWSRWIFEPWAISIFLAVIGCLYLSGGALCFACSTNRVRHWLKAFCFMGICSAGFAMGFVFKQVCLGIGVYFVPSMSMHPALKPGEFILVDTWVYNDRLPQEKDIVVFRHGAKDQWLVKRIATWPDGQLIQDEAYFLLGDNQNASLDSRNFGGVQASQMIGKVKLVLLGINQQHQIIESSGLKTVQ